jgi:hypothetical protein
MDIFRENRLLDSASSQLNPVLPKWFPPLSLPTEFRM